MKYPKLLTTLVALFAASCGGGSGSSDLIGGIQGSGYTVAVGTITGFGSIFVNGVEFSTSNAQIRIDGRPGTEAELRIGQVVTVKGTVASNGTTGVASEVSFAAEVEGPVTQLDMAAGSFVVLGQTVRVTSRTRFDTSIVPSDIKGLAAAGLRVDVSGFRNAAGEISATRIERGDPDDDYEVKGTVQALDTTARTFRINALTVDYSAANLQATLAEGQLVEVEGSSLGADGVLMATSVEVAGGLGATRDDAISLEGLITRFASTADFDVAGQRVSTSAATQFELNGVALGLDVRVEIEGSMDASGVLIADEVEVELEGHSGAAGLIEAVDAAAGTLRIAGVSITADAATQFEDKLDMPVRPLRLADLRVGDYLEVRGVEPQSGGLKALIIEREDPEEETTLQGIARDVADPGLVLLGIDVSVDAGTSFEDTAGLPLTRADFFAQAPERLVEASGRIVGTTLVAEELALEDE